MYGGAIDAVVVSNGNSASKPPGLAALPSAANVPTNLKDNNNNNNSNNKEKEKDEQAASQRMQNMNLVALQRLDNKITKVLATAGHVALYTFYPDRNEWERKKVEGSLFVVLRTHEPLHQVVVLNRLNTENWVEPITLDLDMEVVEPYLLFRNQEEEITGVWFYQKPEQQRICDSIKTIFEGLEQKEAKRKAQPAPSPQQQQQPSPQQQQQPSPQQQQPVQQQPSPQQHQMQQQQQHHHGMAFNPQILKQSDGLQRVAGGGFVDAIENGLLSAVQSAVPNPQQHSRAPVAVQQRPQLQPQPHSQPQPHPQPHPQPQLQPHPHPQPHLHHPQQLQQLAQQQQQHHAAQQQQMHSLVTQQQHHPHITQQQQAPQQQQTPISKDQFRNAILQLVQDERFISAVYDAYVSQNRKQ